MTYLDRVRESLGPKGFEAFCKGGVLVCLEDGKYAEAAEWLAYLTEQPASPRCEATVTPEGGNYTYRCEGAVGHDGAHGGGPKVLDEAFTQSQPPTDKRCPSKSNEGYQCEQMTGHGGIHGASDANYDWLDWAVPGRCLTTSPAHLDHPEHQCRLPAGHDEPHASLDGGARYVWDDTPDRCPAESSPPLAHPVTFQCELPAGHVGEHAAFCSPEEAGLTWGQDEPPTCPAETSPPGTLVIYRCDLSPGHEGQHESRSGTLGAYTWGTTDEELLAVLEATDSQPTPEQWRLIVERMDAVGEYWSGDPEKLTERDRLTLASLWRAKLPTDEQLLAVLEDPAGLLTQKQRNIIADRLEALGIPDDELRGGKQLRYGWHSDWRYQIAKRWRAKL